MPQTHRTRPQGHALAAARWVVALAIVLAAGRTAAAATEPQPAAALDAKTAAQVRDCIAGLDSNAFSEREQAARRLDTLVQDPRLGACLAAEFGRRLLASDTSLEVRARLEQYLKGLPPAPAAAGDAKTGAAEIGPLLDGLNSDRSSERDTARRRIDSILAQVELVAPMLVEVKRRLADARLHAPVRRALESVLDRTREAWVNSDPASVPLPPVTQATMDRWLDDYLLPDPLDGAGRVRRDSAQGELIDLLVRDDTREPLLELVGARIVATNDSGIAGRLQELVDFTKPAMAAEVWGHQRAEVATGQSDDWNHRQHLTVQHLIVGVPQMAETAIRPTHFDRIDDETAHCVSGNSLAPGDYPVGVAIPHPTSPTDVMFYLVNLSTPRRRLAYAYHLRHNEAERLLEISQRTLNHFLAHRQPLDENHIAMLLHLDPRAVSRFVGAYFQAVPDRPMPSDSGDVGGDVTIHRMICSALITIGTHEAVPALDKLARSDASLKPTQDNPFHFVWIAALAIARRDPWPGTDEWLAGLIDDTQPLVSNADPVPDLGATAAGLLLERHEISPYSFDLEPAGNDAFDRSRFAGFAFSSAAGRKAVRQWWAQRKDAKIDRAGP